MQAYLCFLEEIAYQFVYKKYDQLACTSVLVCIPDPSFVYIAMSCVMFHTRPSITTYTRPTSGQGMVWEHVRKSVHPTRQVLFILHWLDTSE